MPILPDHWIRRMASEHGMIEPFVEAQRREGVISYESALFYSSNPSEFALRVSGVSSASDKTFDESGKGGLDLSQGFTP